MFGFTGMVCCQMAMFKLQHDTEVAFEKSLEGIDPGVAVECRRKRQESQEKARLGSIAERRHQELCQAIRSTSFWRLGA